MNVSQEMIKRLKADVNFYIRKRPLAFAATCCCLFCVLVCLSIFLEDIDDAIHSDVILSETKHKSRMSQEKEAINVFIIVCKRVHGNQVNVVRTFLTNALLYMFDVRLRKVLDRLFKPQLS